MRAQARDGQPPDPAELRAVLGAAQARARALAAGLGLEQRPGPQADPEGLEAYEEALLLCMDLTLWGLELVRGHGPAYLPLPGEAP